MALSRKGAGAATAGFVARPATVLDIPDIVNIWGELAEHHARLDRSFAPSARWRDEYEQFIRTLLGRNDALAVVADEGGRVIGYAVGRITLLPAFFEQRRRGYIHDVVTREAYRRRGVGRRLVETLLDWMRRSNVPVVELTVAARNTGAVRFWQRLGFGTYMYHMRRRLTRDERRS